MFFRQDRAGKDGKTFRIWKFRTMVDGASRIGLGNTVANNDSRITAVGRVLRNLSLDPIEEFLYAEGGLTPVGFLLIYAIIAGSIYAWSTRGDRARERVAAMPPDRRRNAKLALYGLIVGLLLLYTLRRDTERYAERWRGPAPGATE